MRVYWVAVPKSMRARRINSLLRTLPPWLAELPLRKLLLNNCYGLEADALHSGEPASQPASQRSERPDTAESPRRLRTLIHPAGSV
jgi:hypothetical protein